jgi:hypothetical protein
MSSIYGSSEPTGSVGPQRDAITAALMAIRQPPPIPPAQALGTLPPTGFGSGLSPQPAALGQAQQPTGPMGPIGGAMATPGLSLPGITPPGQLPQGMGAQGQAMPGAPRPY